MSTSQRVDQCSGFSCSSTTGESRKGGWYRHYYRVLSPESRGLQGFQSALDPKSICGLEGSFSLVVSWVGHAECGLKYWSVWWQVCPSFSQCGTCVGRSRYIEIVNASRKRIKWNRESMKETQGTDNTTNIYKLIGYYSVQQKTPFVCLQWRWV